MIARLNCQFVQRNMVYAEANDTPEKAIRHLGELMAEDMRLALLAQEDAVAETKDKAPGMPAYLLTLEWPDGTASLNLFCGPDGWFDIWTFEMRRLAWLPVLPKRVSTEPRRASLEAFRQDIARVCAATAQDAAAYLQKRSPAPP